jgi:sarcosine oxidase subunit delta
VLLIPCPYCGPRNASEFAYRGEPRRRPDVGAARPSEWRDYLYGHSNRAGWVLEGWYHRAGCRRFIRVERHTVTNNIRWSGPAQAAPAAPGDEAQP